MGDHDQVLKDALSLSPAERVALVEHLLASLDTPPHANIDALWAGEAEDRIDGYERGEIPTIAAQAVFDGLRNRQR